MKRELSIDNVTNFNPLPPRYVDSPTIKGPQLDWIHWTPDRGSGTNFGPLVKSYFGALVLALGTSSSSTIEIVKLIKAQFVNLHLFNSLVTVKRISKLNLKTTYQVL